MKNYFRYSFYLAATTFMLLAGLWFVPGGAIRVAGEEVDIRRVNIVGDVWGDSVITAALGDPYFDSSAAAQLAVDEEDEAPVVYYVEEDAKRRTVAVIRGALGDDVEIGVDKRAVVKRYKAGNVEPQTQVTEPVNTVVAEKKMRDTATRFDARKFDAPLAEPKTAQPQAVNDMPVTADKRTAAVVPADGARTHGGITPIEGSGNPLFRNFLAKLRSGKRVRIAVCGDSFIEGDIFTQDFREQLQMRFGGGGVGYVPITSQVAGFRQSVGHSFSGWTTKSALNGGSKADFLLSGYLFTPSEGAWVTYKGSKVRSRLATFARATLVFVNRGNTEITATVNDTVVSVFRPEASEGLQSVTVVGEGAGIKSVRFKVSKVQGFMAYGALLDEHNGVSVDNFSIRSYSGAALANISTARARQATAIAPYDLIIMEYGLNVASASTLKYDQYASQMVRTIEHLQAVYPGVAIMVMSVSDRQNRAGGGWVTMPGIVAMERTQRGIASQCGVSFWSTLKAMQSIGGMNYFVQKGWAAKDYTHLSATGGRVVATELIKSLDNTK